MQWARDAGFEVPEIELRTLRDLLDVLPEADPATPVFAIRRFDRKPEPADRAQRRATKTRIHQEDFQQVVGRQPSKKYDDITYEGVALLAARIVGDDAYLEVLRRLVFVVASGNNDAHMKNWSVIYPDGIQAQLSPLYDQVFTAQWPAFSVQMALKLGGTKEFAAVTLARFRELARRVGQSPEETGAVVSDAMERITAGWAKVREEPAVTDAYRAPPEFCSAGSPARVRATGRHGHGGGGIGVQLLGPPGQACRQKFQDTSRMSPVGAWQSKPQVVRGWMASPDGALAWASSLPGVAAAVSSEVALLALGSGSTPQPAHARPAATINDRMTGRIMGWLLLRT